MRPGIDFPRYRKRSSRTMTTFKEETDAERSETWERELVARHRWGRLHQWFNTDKEKPQKELERLRGLAQKAGPLEPFCSAIVDQIATLEICNWNLEESILDLCRAIGSKKPSEKGIGHMASMSRERWKKVWAYYLALRHWLPGECDSGYHALLPLCDPSETIQNQVSKSLGERNRLKELYVERFCICLERWLAGWPSTESAQIAAHEAAVAAIESEIAKFDPQGEVLSKRVFSSDGNGRLNLCNHKVFSRYDLIISSIGAERWRAGLPTGGTDGLERAALVERHLAPIEAWIRACPYEGESTEDALAGEIRKMLGERDHTKLFLASLLASLLRSQQVAARRLAESRLRGSKP